MQKLKKPYTSKQKSDFIVKHNHNQGLRIEETETALYALEPWEKLEGDEVIDDKEAWEKEQEQKERERISSLKMTKRVFALGLQQLGISYQQLKELIASNEQAQLEWDLCVELERSNPLLDVMAEEIGVTPAQLDIMFRKANGEEVEIPPIEGAEVPLKNEELSGDE